MGIEFSSSSMVVDQLNVKGIVPLKAKNNSPIGPHRHGPESFQGTFQGMKTIPGQVQTLGACGGVEDRKDSFHGFQEVGPYPASVATLIETFQASMLEAPNHQGAV
jgi:hypothetical protein